MTRTMNRTDIERRVRDVVARTLKVERSRVTPDAAFVEDLGASSLQSIELVAAFEDEFDIEMDETRALGVKDVRGAVEFIEQYL